MNKTRVFISRSLDEASVLRKLSDRVEWIDQSLIEIKPKAFEWPLKEEFDWIFFYSKNGVRHFFDQLSEKEIQDISNKKFGCLGPGTAQQLLEQTGLKPTFIGEGEAVAVAEYLRAEDGVVLFIRAENSLASVERLLPKTATLSLAVYDNQPKKNIRLPQTDVCILTSPMNAEAYLSCPACRVDLKVIAIGPTTNSYLMQRNFFLALVPDTPSEEGIYRLLKTLLHGN